jgi:hypothetical protein
MVDNVFVRGPNRRYAGGGPAWKLVDRTIAERELVVLPVEIHLLPALWPDLGHDLAPIAVRVVRLVPLIVGVLVTYSAQSSGIQFLPDEEQIILQAHRFGGI